MSTGEIDPPKDDNEYFERMCFTIFRSGLNTNVLNAKWPAIRSALQEFDTPMVAEYAEPEIDALMADPRIIRSRPKISAVVKNAREMLGVATEYGSFSNYLDALWTNGGEFVARDAISKRFAFLGRTTTVMFLLSVGRDMPESQKQCEGKLSH
jgi:3-methyladenine DNA glycosylase Tag